MVEGQVEQALRRTQTAVTLFRKHGGANASTLELSQLTSLLEELAATREGAQDVKAYVTSHPPDVPANFETVVKSYNGYVDWILAGGAGGAPPEEAGEAAGDADPLTAAAAVAADDADALEEALKGGADANEVVDGSPLIVLAAEAESVDLVQVLLQCGGQVNAPRKADGFTALMVAAAASNHDLVEVLLKHGADSSLKNAEGKSASELTEDEETLALIAESGDTHEVEAKGTRSKSAIEEQIAVKRAKPRRTSVSAESMDPTKATTVAKKVIEKQDADKERIRATLLRSFLFKHSDGAQQEDLINAMYEVRRPAGTDIIKQGDREANEFFMIDSGEVEVFKGHNEDGSERLMITLGPGAMFGELALMYNTPRAATVRAKSEEVVLWAMDRDSFKQIVLVQTMQKRLKYEAFLEKVELLKDLSQYERATIADSFKEETVAAGAELITEGDKGNEMYFLVKGTAKAYAKGEHVATYEEPGTYFGELALLNDEPRLATVKTTSDCDLVSLDRAAFERMMGPVIEVLKRNTSRYAKFLQS